MDALKLRFKRKNDTSTLTVATKQFLKGTGDDGLQALPTILDECSRFDGNEPATAEVLDLITKYYAQNSHLSRQVRCVDLLRYLSDQKHSCLYSLLSSDHPLMKLIDGNLSTTKTPRTLQKATRILLDHLVRQGNVSDSIIALHAKHVNGIASPYKPTIILSDQEVVADDIRAAEAEADLLSTLLTDSTADQSLLNEVYGRIQNTRERLVRDVETSTNEHQTNNIINSIDLIDRVIVLHKEIHDSEEARIPADHYHRSPSGGHRRSSNDSRQSTSGRSSGRPSADIGRRRKGKEAYVEPDDEFQKDMMLSDERANGVRSYEDYNDGEGSSKHAQENFLYAQHLDSIVVPDRMSRSSPDNLPHQASAGSRHFSSNNPFAQKEVEPKVSEADLGPNAKRNPFAVQIDGPHNPFRT